jgi:hypothetical protein
MGVHLSSSFANGLMLNRMNYYELFRSKMNRYEITSALYWLHVSLVKESFFYLRFAPSFSRSRAGMDVAWSPSPRPAEFKQGPVLAPCIHRVRYRQVAFFRAKNKGPGWLYLAARFGIEPPSCGAVKKNIVDRCCLI